MVFQCFVMAQFLQFHYEYFRQWEAICKPRHWNLGTGIGTDIKNAIISSYIRPMDTKPSWVVTYDEGTPLSKSRGTSISWSSDK